MKKTFPRLAPYLLALAVDFYLLPLLARDTGPAMLMMLCVMPLIALAAGVLYGVRHGFGVLLAAAALVLFVPAVFLYYNASAWVYAPAYALLVLAGTGIGRLFHGRR